MGSAIKRLFTYGFPGQYGGAGTELHHQVLVWLRMGLQVHIIPSDPCYRSEPLYREMLQRGVTIHEHNEWSALDPGDPVLGFCNSEFLENLHLIRLHTRRTVFVNCMTWIFDKERESMASDQIAMFLYQSEDVRQRHEQELRALNSNPNVQFVSFKPYFEMEHFPFIEKRSEERFGCGRISRQDADKFAKNTLHIYEYFVSPKWKSGLFLGFDERSESKIGTPYDWIKTARDHTEVSQQEFYRHCDIILQPTDTTENWPRVGFEAMSSGSVLIVDNRGGWKQQVVHGKTGWLCNHERDFIYYASKMAYEPNMRSDMAAAAKERAKELGGLSASIASWESILERMTHLTE